ncbi:putative uncharacterized transposon-derived protein F54H12.3 [Orchesella cincta]|uniref:Uncharacterized transposon-derived protein F54H12.3 n=1 Tax=Orchesella cincta TaxID=48709 RepID=A0A1D2M5Q4_ORCCI|nr:putative uncharacterized transposon-derived protein F54H12.3 [Orchesella cincta]
MNKLDKIKEVYFNPSEVGSYASLYSFLQNNKIRSIKDLEHEMTKLKTYTLFKPARKNFKRRRDLVQGYGELWNIDLLDMQKFFRFNKGLKYILVVVEGLSKKAYCRGIKNKRADSVKVAFEEIVKEAGYAPRLIHADRGNEWGGTFRRYLEQVGSKLYHSYTDKGAVLAERMNRIIRSRLYAIMFHNKDKIWYTHLQPVISSYNSTKNSRYRLSPNEVNKDNQFSVWKRIYKDYVRDKTNQKPSRLQVNDIVKISREKLLFEKGATHSFSLENFKIIKVEPTVPWTYRLADVNGEELAGGFLYEQLQKVEPESLQDD